MDFWPKIKDSRVFTVVRARAVSTWRAGLDLFVSYETQLRVHRNRSDLQVRNQCENPIYIGVTVIYAQWILPYSQPMLMTPAKWQEQLILVFWGQLGIL